MLYPSSDFENCYSFYCFCLLYILANVAFHTFTKNIRPKLPDKVISHGELKLVATTIAKLLNVVSERIVGDYNCSILVLCKDKAILVIHL